MSNVKDVQKWLDDEFEIKLWPSPIRAIAMANQVVFNKNIIDSWNIVRRGTESIHAKFLQAILICMGYECNLDGIFAFDSVDALKQYQRDNGFIVNGICGKAIIRRIFKEE